MFAETGEYGWRMWNATMKGESGGEEGDVLYIRLSGSDRVWPRWRAPGLMTDRILHHFSIHSHRLPLLLCDFVSIHLTGRSHLSH